MTSRTFPDRGAWGINENSHVQKGLLYVVCRGFITLLKHTLKEETSLLEYFNTLISSLGGNDRCI